MTLIKDFRLCHGLLFDQSGVRLAHKRAVQANWSIEESPKTRPSVQLTNIHRTRDTFVYANNLALDKERTLFNPPKPFSRFKENNPLYDETPDNAVIFRIDKELWNINLTREDIKPTDEFVEAIKKAIEHNTPLRALDDVFSEYGYWMNCKVKVGCRLERFIQFQTSALGNEYDHEDVELFQTEWIGDESLDRENGAYKEICAEWSKRIHPLRSSYLLSADSSLIRIEKIGEWLEYSPTTASQWSVIERADFVPTYKLLDESLIAKVERLFSDETEVLMTGESPIDCQCADICQVKFFKPLLSDAYKVDGDVYNSGKRCDVAVTLYFASIYGFSLEIEWDEFPKEVEVMYVKWKLTGNRAKI
ncbi:2581_t:CDS:2, partial [Paraglomus occultum]